MEGRGFKCAGFGVGGFWGSGLEGFAVVGSWELYLSVTSFKVWDCRASRDWG